MAIDVSRIQNNSKFDPVREALIDLEAQIADTGSSIGNGTITISTSGNLTGSGSFTLNQAGNSTITIGIDDSSYLTSSDITDFLTQTDTDLLYLPLSGGTLTGDLSGTNLTLTGYLRGPSTLIIDPAAHSNATGLVQILGDLRVDGTTTIINSTTINVSDKNITIAKDALTAGDANGAGITIAGANATLTYASVTDDFTFNKSINAVGGTFSGNVTGANLAISNWNDAYGWGDHDGLYLPIAGGTLTGDLTIDDKLTITGTNNNLVIDETSENTWHLYDTSQSNGIVLHSGSGGMELQYNGVTELTIDGSGVSFTGTINLDAADLNIGSADIIFGTAAGGATRGLVWSVSGSGYLSKLIGGGTDGGKVTLFANMDDAITTGNIFEIKDGSTGSLFLGLSHAGILTAGGGTSTQWNTAYSYSQVGHLPLTGGTITGSIKISGQSAVANYGGTGLNFDFTSGNIGRIASVKTTSGGSQLQFIVYNTSGVDVNALQISSAGDVGIGVSPTTKLDVNGVITATGGTSTQWNTAYGWGNHADGGYQAAATAITTSNIGSQSVNYANTAGSTSYLSSLGNYVWSASTNGRDFNQGIQTSFVRSEIDGYPSYGSVVRVKSYSESQDGGTAELYFPYSSTYGGTSMRYRLGQYPNAGWTGWKTVIDSDSISSQSVAYATNAGTLDSLDSTQFLRSDESDTMTGSLTINASGVGLNVSSTQNTGLIVDGGTNSGIIAEFKNSTTKAIIDNSGGGYFLGSIGIGRTSPQSKLHVVGGGDTFQFAMKLAKSSYDDVGGHTTLIGIGCENAAWSRSAIGHTRTTSYDAGYLGFYVSNNNGNSDELVASDLRMMINRDGNVGIGTNSPYRKLQVDGHAGVRNGSFFLGDESGSTNDGFQFYKSSNILRIYKDTGSFGGTSNPEGLNLDLFSGSAYATRISGNGNSYFGSGGGVGIGLTNVSYTLDVASVSSGDWTTRFTNSNGQATYFAHGGGYGGYINAGSNASASTYILELVSGGQSRAYFRGDGNVGIGTNSPLYKLHVSGDAYISTSLTIGSTTNIAAAAWLQFNGANVLLGEGTNTYLQANGGGSIIFRNNSPSTLMTLTNAGNLGIGTNSPSSRLQIDKSSQTIGGTTPNGGLLISSLAAGNAVLEIGVDPTSLSYLQSRNITSNTPYQLLLNPEGGNVGIGTTSPSQKLHVDGFIRYGTDSYYTNTGYDSNGFYTDTNGSTAQTQTIRIQSNFLSGVNNYNGIKIGALAIGNASEGVTIYTGGYDNNRLTITANGLVGIGTPSPTRKLHVEEATTWLGRFAYNANNYVDIRYDGFNVAGGDMVFQNAGSEKMRITTAGSVGIGTTSPAAKLHVVGDGTNAGGIILRQGSNQLHYIYTSSQFQLNRIGSSAATWRWGQENGSDFMTLTSTGLGIGTTNPQQNLTVVGTSGSIGDTFAVYNTSANTAYKNTVNIGDERIGTWGLILGKSGASTLDNNYHYPDGAHIVNVQNGPIRFGTNNDYRMQISASGNVSIGNTNNTYKLDVAGTTRVSLSQNGSDWLSTWDNTATNGHKMYFGYGNDGGTRYGLYIEGGTTSNHDLAVANKFYVYGNGNVGVGSSTTAINNFAVIKSNTYGYYNRTEALAVFQGVLPTLLVAHDGNDTNEYAEIKLGNNQTTYYPYSAYIRGVQAGGINYYKLEFGTSNNAPSATRMTIAFDGKVGIGTTDPTHQLHIATDNDNTYALRVQGATNNAAGVWTGIGLAGESANTKAAIIFEDIGDSYSRGKLHFAINNVEDQTSATPSNAILTISNNGNVGIGDTTPDYKLDVNGAIRATGDVYAYSDARVKENIQTIDNALDKVMSMRGVSYNRTDDDDKTKKVGVIAQEIQKILPEVVSEQEDGMLSVSYGNIVGVLIEAIKEQQKQIDELKSLLNGSTK